MGKSKTIQLSGFPSNVSAQSVKVFLEQHTGEKSVYAIKIRQAKNGRAFAVVQFTTLRQAESIISLANPRLWYGSSYLKAYEMELDIVPKPRTFSHSMEHITLHFGCQISKEKFSVLWRVLGVSVNFGPGLRKLYLHLSYHQVEYRLELSYENVWKIQLHRPRGQTAKFLLIQVVWFHIDYFEIHYSLLFIPLVVR